MTNRSSYIGLANPKSPQNVGTILRAAGCYGVSSVFYSGQRYLRAKEFVTDTRQMHKQIPTTACDDLILAKPAGVKLVAIELVEGAIALMDYQHPNNAYYIFGPEDGSLDQDLVSACDDVVYIPTVGCMNLAATVNVVLYDRMAKSPDSKMGDELIRSSRDTNNKVRVRRAQT